MIVYFNLNNLVKFCFRRDKICIQQLYKPKYNCLFFPQYATINKK